jgi:hypothetical protein
MPVAADIFEVEDWGSMLEPPGCAEISSSLLDSKY